MPKSSSSASASGKRTKVLTLPKLSDENFDNWDLAAKHCFYSCGWLKMYEISEQKNGKDNAASEDDRMSAWGTITDSLPPEKLKQINKVKLGDVEGLLRTIRSQFYRQTAGTRNNLKDKLQNAKLEDFDDFEAYAASLELVISRLSLSGLGYDVERKTSLLPEF